MNKHTPVPWMSGIWEDETYYKVFQMESIIPLAKMTSPIPKADAEFIVRACNNYYSLLETLKEIKSLAVSGEIHWKIGPGFYEEIEEKAKQAIDKAEEDN